MDTESSELTMYEKDSQFDYRDINRALKRKVKAAKKSGNGAVLLNTQFLDNVSVALDNLVFYWSKKKQGAKNSTDLIKELREKAEGFGYDGWVETAILLEKAADAIEELSSKYERALHDIVKEDRNARR